jgi:hypothetical protein
MQASKMMFDEEADDNIFVSDRMRRAMQAFLVEDESDDEFVIVSNQVLCQASNHYCGVTSSRSSPLIRSSSLLSSSTTYLSREASILPFLSTFLFPAIFGLVLCYLLYYRLISYALASQKACLQQSGHSVVTPPSPDEIPLPTARRNISSENDTISDPCYAGEGGDDLPPDLVSEGYFPTRAHNGVVQMPPSSLISTPVCTHSVRATPVTILAPNRLEKINESTRLTSLTVQYLKQANDKNLWDFTNDQLIELVKISTTDFGRNYYMVQTELRHYFAEHFQQEMNREQKKRHHQEWMKVSQQDREWQTRLVNAKTETAASLVRACLHSFLLTVTLTLAYSVHGYYQFWTQATLYEVLCPTSTSSSTPVSSSWWVYMYETVQAAANPNSYFLSDTITCVQHNLARGIYAAVFSVFYMVFSLCRLPSFLQNIIAVLYLSALIWLNDLLPQYLLQRAGFIIILGCLAGSIMVELVYRQMRENLSVLGNKNEKSASPYAEEVNDRLAVFHDLRTLLQVSPLFVAGMWFLMLRSGDAL